MNALSVNAYLYQINGVTNAREITTGGDGISEMSGYVNLLINYWSRTKFLKDCPVPWGEI